MFNSTVLDVFIGLILVFLLYSLLVTILGEIICNWIGLRARILRVSIEKMLNDGYYASVNPQRYSGIRYRINRFFLKQFPDFEHSFAGKFYKYPAIKYLSMKAGEEITKISQTKPSYLSAEMFADSLIQILKDKGAGEEEMDKIHFCLNFNTYFISPATLRNLRNMAEAAGPDINIFKEKLKTWYNETQDRATGWYKGKLQLILFWLGFIIAVAFNVDAIKIARILSKDKDARNQLVAMGIELAKDSARYKDFTGARPDSGYSQTILDSGYARVTKDINEASLVLGLGWNMDKLLTDCRIEIDTEENKKAYALIAKDTVNLRELRELLHKKDSLLAQDLVTIDNNKEFLQDLKVKYFSQTDTSAVRISIDSTQRILQAALEQKTSDSLALRVAQKRLHDKHRAANAAVDSAFTIINKIEVVRSGNKDLIVISGSRKYDWVEKTGHVLATIFWYSILGFFITGLALSLGAPFWFDLLKKLVSVRTDGIKPEEKPVKKEDAEKAAIAPDEKAKKEKTPAPAEPAEDVYEEAIRLFEKPIKSIPGVKSVFKVIDRTTKQKNIQVNVDTATTATAVNNKFATLTVGTVTLTPQVVISGTPQTQQANLGIISNKSKQNGSGSLGCILQRTDNQTLHLLSCWHVMKGNTMYGVTDDLNVMVDHMDDDCGRRWAGGIDAQFDYGIAQIIPSSSTNAYNNHLKTQLKLKNQIRFRELTKRDIAEQIDIQYYDCLTQTVRNGFIFANSRETDVNYLDKTRTINDVLLLTNSNDKTISNPGNSGSIIFDMNGFAIAMIISGDIKYTYAVKLSHIFDIHSEMKIA